MVKGYSSLPQMVRDLFAGARSGNMYSRRDNAWTAITPSEFLDDVRSLTLALRELGVKPGVGVGIIARSCPEWFVADLSIQTCRAWTIPLFPNLSPDIFRFECQDSNVQILIIEHPSLLPQDIQDQYHLFQHVIVLQPETPLTENELAWSTVIARGRVLRKMQGDSWFDQQVDGLSRNDIATIIYTSGSTGVPKGVEISHGNLLFQFEGASELYPLNREEDRALSVLPVAHVFERMVIYYFLSAQIPIYFGNHPKEIATYLAEVRPTIMSTVPRILERVYEKMALAHKSASGLKRLILMLAIHHAKKANPEQPGFLHGLWDKLVFSKMRAALGDSFRYIVSGSSALNPNVHRFLLNVGLPIFDGYGLTECAPVLAAATRGRSRPGSVGPIFPGVQLRIGERDEVQAISPGCMLGYHNNAEATRECFTRDGWLRTGDIGRIDADGFVFLTGRLKELYKTSTGKYVSPLPIEMALMRHPLVEYAVVIAEQRKFVSVLLFLDSVQTASYLKKQNFDLTKASQSKHVRARMNRLIQRVNLKLNEWERIQKWTIVPETLTPEQGLLTPTLKIRRHAIDKHYSEIIESLYL